MPIIEGIQSTTIWKAFLLNSITSTLIIFISITIKERFDQFKDKDNRPITRTTNPSSILLTLSSAFITAMIAYTIMYLLFGFGGGMLV
jgi:hypothetical protein